LKKLRNYELNDVYRSPNIVRADGRIKLRWIFRKWDVGVCTGSNWLRLGTGGGLLWMR